MTDVEIMTAYLLGLVLRFENWKRIERGTPSRTRRKKRP